VRVVDSVGRWLVAGALGAAAQVELADRARYLDCGRDATARSRALRTLAHAWSGSERPRPREEHRKRGVCVCGPTVACWEEPAGRLLVVSGGSGVDAGRPRARCVSVRAPAASGAWANATDYSTCDVNLMMILSKCEHRQTGAITASMWTKRKF
jgi:hypothetical protein